VERREYKEALNRVVQAKYVLITSHRSPDGDAIGSSLALFNFFKKLGVNVEVIVPDAFPEFLNWIPGVDTIMRYDKNTELIASKVEKADLILSVDYNVLSRVGPGFSDLLENCKTDMIIIDHHREPAEHYQNYIHDIKSSSTAQLVFDWMDHTGHRDKIDLGTAQAIYTGIVTDTGSFRFSSTSYRTHEIAGILMQFGLDTSAVYNKIFDNNSFDRLQLLGYTLSQKMKHLADIQLAYIVLSVEEMKRFNFKSGDTEGFVNYALSIKGVQMACLMKEDEKGGVKMSFRSKGLNHDMNQFARKYFNGGGHLNAAGGKSNDNLETTEANFVEAIKTHFK
jgi:phosphoesterase RecJ-like protein